MNRVLNKRILRDLKNNFMRYLALFLLIVMGMYIILSVVGAAENVITGTKLRAEENKIEDGQFTVFLPLTEEQENEITDKGVTLERMFSFDIDMSDGSVLRIFKDRKNIDLADIDEGKSAERIGEAVLEKRYCEEHDISVGDSIEIRGISFEVTGIGSIPDYDMPVGKTSDTAVDSTLFGVVLVTDEQYEEIKTDGDVEEYCYSYRLNNTISHDNLKEIVKGFDFDYNDIDNVYFKEMIEDTVGKKDDLLDGINELKDGSEELSDGLSELDKNGDKLTDGADEIFLLYLAQANSELSQLGVPELTADNYGEVLDDYISLTGSAELISLKDSLDGLKDLSDGAAEYTDGVNKAYDGSKELADGIAELKSETDKLIGDFFTVDIDNLTSFIKAEDNPRIMAAAGDMQMNKNVGLLAGVIVMVLFTYVISVFVVHQIQNESSVIGTLYALGVKKNNLIGHYIALPTIISFVGGLTGSAIGFSKFGIPVQMMDSYIYYSIPELELIYPLYLIIYAIVMPPVISIIVNYLVINKRLSRTALSLIRNEQKIDSRGKIDLKRMGFLRRFQIRQMLREARTSITVVFGMIISLLIFMLAADCLLLCENVAKDSARDTKYEYMYTLKYPPKTVPKGAEACYMESLSITAYDYTLDISIVGIDNDNKYYGITPEKGKSRITAGLSVIQKYGLKKGDTIVLTDNASDMSYAFTIADVADYSAGLTVFMDIDSMRELFGQEDDYFNVLLSDKELDIDEGRIYSVTTKSDIERSTSVFTELMMPMVVTLTIVSVIIFCVVMYLMINVMIERASAGISLVKIFGYRTEEIRRLYLNGNAAVAAAAAIIGIPVSKAIMDSMYPYFVSNVSCGLNIAFPWYMYVLIFIAIMAIYFIINTLLVRKLKRISPAVVLKNRE